LAALPLGMVAAAEAAPSPENGGAESSDREGARRRRRRGGRGRNRGEGGSDAIAASDVGEDLSADIGVDETPEAEATAAAEMVATAPASPVAAALLPQPPQAREPIVVPAAGSAELPRAQPYRLPIDELNAVAASAGLEWVHSDAGKVQAVQAAIAAAPQPARVPRQPRPPVAIDDGPLVLVETKKDLTQIRLPFDHPPAN
jgi:ribonuclease E